jgi:endonuclease YncB( thermonuclease family)
MKTGLFWFLHRACRAIFWLAWLGVLLFLYRHRAILEPAREAFELWRQRTPAAAASEAGVCTGRVTRVYSGDGFQLRDSTGSLYNLGLAGVAVPKTGADARRLAGPGLTNLTRLIQGTAIEVRLTVSNPQTRTGLGIAWLGPTNVNELLLSGGWGRLQRDQIRSLPLAQQLRFVQAERDAKFARRGVWGTGIPTPPETHPPGAQPGQ